MGTQKSQPNCWSAAQAAEWAGVNYRLMLDLLDQKLLPAIKLNPTAPGKQRKRRAARWLVPREAFQAAWRTFSGSPVAIHSRRRQAVSHGAQE